MRMRAIVVRSLGGPEVLRVEEVPRPSPPGEGEVTLRIRAAGVNFADTERRRGIYGSPSLPWIPGREAAGEVVATGPGVAPGLEGARVAYFSANPSGSYAEFATVPVESLFQFERELPFEEMAALPAQGLTAHGLVRFAGLVPGRCVVVLAAAGGVGQLLVQLARQVGARVIGVVSGPAKQPVVTALGAEVVVGYERFDEAVRGLTAGRGADVVFDSVGLATQAQSIAALARYGQLIHFGDASGLPLPIDVDSLYARSLRIGAFGLDIDADPEGAAAARLELTAALVRGELRMAVTKRLPLAEAAAAHRALEDRITTGKIVLIL